MKKVLALLLSSDLYGKERSNIEVFNVLQKSPELDLLVVVNIELELKRHDYFKPFNYIAINFPNRDNYKNSIFKYVLALIKTNLKLYKILHINKPDILFLNTEKNFYDLFPILLCYKGKIIYRIGDSPAYKDLRFYWLNSRIWEKFIVKRVDRFVYISNFIKRSVEKTGRDSLNDMVIYNYPPNRGVYNEKNKEPLKYFPDLNIVVFGFIGQIIENKGVKLFVEAANKLTSEGYNAKYLIAGNTQKDSNYGDMVMGLASENRNITFIGEIEDIEIFYKSIHVLCVPSIYQEPLGNVLVEAKQHCRPCLIFPSGGMPELISHNYDGYICENKSVESLYKGMKYYLDNKDILQSEMRNSFDSIKKLGIDRQSYERKWMTAINLY